MKFPLRPTLVERTNRIIHGLACVKEIATAHFPLAAEFRALHGEARALKVKGRMACGVDFVVSRIVQEGVRKPDRARSKVCAEILGTIADLKLCVPPEVLSALRSISVSAVPSAVVAVKAEPSPNQ